MSQVVEDFEHAIMLVFETVQHLPPTLQPQVFAALEYLCERHHRCSLQHLLEAFVVVGNEELE